MQASEFYHFMLDMLPSDSDYLWIARAGDSIQPLEVVDKVVARLDASRPVGSLRECDVRACCARYRHYKGVLELSAEDLEFTSSECEAILWLQKATPSSAWCYVVSLKDYLEIRDPGFAGFNNHHEGVDAA